MDPSLPQITAMRHLILKNRNLYAELAIWTPFGERFQEKLHFVGNFMSAGGEVVKIRVSGPGDFKQWLECYTILKMVFLGFDQVESGTLDAYSDQV